MVIPRQLNLFLILFLWPCLLISQIPDRPTKPIFKPSIDDNTKYTTIGNIGLTITNFGTFGDGFVIQTPVDQPSCEYPRGSGIEHLFDGGIWIGGIRDDGKTLVSTAAVDIASLVDVAAGFEFTNSADPNDVVKERSSLVNSPFYHPLAISHQDFICDYTDSNIFVPELQNTRIPNHTPMGLVVHQESYGWSYPFADDFIILNYTIKNASRDTFFAVYVGLWADMVVRNVNITPPRIGSPFYMHKGAGYSDSLRLAYGFDYNGDPGFTDPGLYVGLKLLGATPQANDPTYKLRTNYNVWLFRNTDNPTFFSPADDIARYDKMKNGLPAAGLNILKSAPGNYISLMTTGPFERLDPDSSINLAFAIICGAKYGLDPNSDDTESSKTNFYINAGWAQTAYNGEDRNGNGQLDPSEDINGNGVLDPGEDSNGNGVLDLSEDINGDGKLTRYVLPTPPTPPKFRVVPEKQKVTIYWANNSEKSRDLITGKQDFEGYRIYRSRLGEDLPGKDLLSSLTLIADFDSIDGIGYDTGFKFIRLPGDSLVYFEDEIIGNDTIFYHYRFVNENLLSGWQYAYAVTAYDRGDPANKLESLESSYLVNVARVLPGTPPAVAEDQELKVGVYPNPYRTRAAWDGNLERDRKIYFYNLPANCEVRIFTLAGDLVDKFRHQHQNYDGTDIQWFQKYARGKTIFAGGEHAWDLVTKDDQAIATGLYLFTVENLETGKIQTGKFLVIK
ncbi:MAG: hypothetical protein ONB16_09910 [candidate division KSB1 bacterium]|nr:hypothetical protein [candidate division KSB1 bacterium]MDZ7318708.1 hypothetical protein [candidate division KSB1 bacterium]MDZ7340551.1 hypothetical protein [candidate division KSB1 bacterium]